MSRGLGQSERAALVEPGDDGLVTFDVTAYVHHGRADPTALPSTRRALGSTRGPPGRPVLWKITDESVYQHWPNDGSPSYLVLEIDPWTTTGCH
jgi:hypothetical protein